MQHHIHSPGPAQIRAGRAQGKSSSHELAQKLALCSPGLILWHSCCLQHQCHSNAAALRKQRAVMRLPQEHVPHGRLISRCKRGCLRTPAAAAAALSACAAPNSAPDSAPDSVSGFDTPFPLTRSGGAARLELDTEWPAPARVHLLKFPKLGQRPHLLRHGVARQVSGTLVREHARTTPPRAPPAAIPQRAPYKFDSEHGIRIGFRLWKSIPIRIPDPKSN